MTEMRTELFLEETFWQEVENNRNVVDEDEGRGNVTDEGETEADWLNEVGFGEMSQQWRQGKSLPEGDLGNAVQKLSLKPHQADAVRKRIRTLNATLKKRRKNRRPPDVRSFFQHDGSDNKDSSRSATPDSLDSGEFVDSSPPRRPSTPNLMENLMNRSDTGVPSFVSVFDNQPLSIASQSPRSNRDIFRNAIRFPIKVTATEDGEVASDDITGIEMINYHNVGTIYMKGYLHCRKPPSYHIPPAGLLSAGQTNQQLNNNMDFNTRTYNVSGIKLGFAEELAKQQQSGILMEEELLTENLYVDPSGLTKLSDLSEDDVKSLRRILLMELTAQCDHLNIQIRRKKIPKSIKKPSVGEDSPTGVFGLSLDTLLAKDRRVTGETTLQVPIAFEKMLNHLWKRSMNDEGLLRLGGNKAKINDLKATFESSLYAEPEQVDVAMAQSSSHDVANLLKQFLRELAIPLLGCEYIDAFFDIADLKDRSQESCLRLLVLLLPQSHQAVLNLLLEFLRELVRNSEVNKMGLTNVAMILAPNLVPSSVLNIRSQTKELNRAATWVCLTRVLIRTGTGLFVVPTDLLSQMRQINDCARQKKLKGVMRNIVTQNSSMLTVSAPQLGFPELCIPVHAGTTAGDIVSYLLEEAERNLEEKGGVNSPVGHVNRRRGGGRGGDFVKTPQGPNLSCLLAQVNKDLSLKSHALFEVGGNIGYRRVDPCALIPAIIRDNPSAAWILRCSHRHSQSFRSTQ